MYKMLAHCKKSYDKPRQPIKKQRHHFADKGLYSQSYDFSSSHVWMWEVDQKEGLATEELTLSNCVTREDSWESFGQQGDQPLNPKGNQPWILIGRTDTEAKAPDVKRQLIGKDPDAGKDWRQEEKGMTEDEMVGLDHWLKGLEFERTAGKSEGKGSLACCSPWGCKELDTTLRLNKNNNCKLI